MRAQYSPLFLLNSESLTRKVELCYNVEILVGEVGSATGMLHTSVIQGSCIAVHMHE